MNKQPIARIRLAYGEVGYYDEYSRIYLSVTSPEAYIYPGTNLYQIKKSIKSGRLRLIEGSLTESAEKKSVTEKIEENIAANVKKESAKEEIVTVKPVIAPTQELEHEAIDEAVNEKEPESNAIEEVPAQEESQPEQEEAKPKPVRRRKKVKEESPQEE